MVRTADQGLAAQVLLQRGLQPETLNGGLVVPLDVGQARKRQPALAGKAVALELDGDFVLQFVAQREDQEFDGLFGLVVHVDNHPLLCYNTNEAAS